jgi:prepilin-type N-terminal cleavage/methylation domain-containing protein/prepilin-type processing-associated H-X9-DG protein
MMKCKNAFTLVELLVVISIIAMLLAVLMPTLNKARESARSIISKTNLKTIGQAEMLYAAQNNGFLVLTRWDRKANEVNYWASQLWAVYNGIKSVPYSNEYFSNRPNGRPNWLVCPSLEKINAKPDKQGFTGYSWSDVRFVVGPASYWWLQNISYARNATGQGYYQRNPDIIIPATRHASLKSPASLAASADSFYIDFYGPNNVHYPTDLYEADGITERPKYDHDKCPGGRQVEFRHDGKKGLNLLLWDGHVGSVRKSIGENYQLDPNPTRR